MIVYRTEGINFRALDLAKVSFLFRKEITLKSWLCDINKKYAVSSDHNLASDESVTYE